MGQALKKIVAAFYRTPGGTEPVRDWLKALSPEDRGDIGQDITTVEYGWPVGMPVCRPLGRGLWEVRSNVSDNRIARIIFWYRSRPDDTSARLHQEDPEHPTGGLGSSPQEDEGDRMMHKRTRQKGTIGSTLDEFLKEEGTYELTQAVAIKRVLAWQIAQTMAKQRMTKAEMARRMDTSRSQLNRLLDPTTHSVTLETLTRAAHAVGRQVKLELV